MLQRKYHVRLPHCIHVLEVLHIHRWTELVTARVQWAYVIELTLEIVTAIGVEILTWGLYMEYVIRAPTLLRK